MKNIIIIASTLLMGCVVGPNFREPKLSVPQSYTNALDTTAVDSIRSWWTNFNDPMLDTLISRAIRGNKNLAVAVKNIEVARLGVASAKSQALPSIGLNLSGQAKYTYQTKTVQQYSIMPAISWDIDLWGKIRREVEAAGASFRATEYQTAAVMQTLVSDVAVTYFSALSYNSLLGVARQTYLTRLNSLRLMDSMYRYGAISDLEIQQAKASLMSAGTAVDQYTRALSQSTLALNLLMGENPTSLKIGELAAVSIDIPVGLPSSLLERRPDVMQAYYGVQQANAMIGVAVANRLPSLSLTGQGGVATTIVNDIATGKPLSWSAAAGIIAPLLNWGTLRRNEKIARVKTQQAVLEYEQAVLESINQVEQALVAVRTTDLELGQMGQMVEASRKAESLTSELYRVGEMSYLDQLDADRTLFAAQIQQVELINSQMANYVTLYKALGGGW